MQDNFRATPRAVMLAATALVIAAIAAFAALSGGGTADAAGTAASAPAAQTQTVQSGDQAMPDRDHHGHPCPEEDGGGGDAGQDSGGPAPRAPQSSSTPDTEL